MKPAANGNRPLLYLGHLATRPRRLGGGGHVLRVPDTSPPRKARPRMSLPRGRCVCGARHGCEVMTDERARSRTEPTHRYVLTWKGRAARASRIAPRGHTPAPPTEQRTHTFSLGGGPSVCSTYVCMCPLPTEKQNWKSLEGGLAGSAPRGYGYGDRLVCPSGREKRERCGLARLRPSCVRARRMNSYR